MIIFIHISVALMGIIASSITALSPTVRGIRVSAASVAATLVTGVYLVLHMHTSLVQACISGLAYLAVTLTALSIGTYRLASVRQRVRR